MITRVFFVAILVLGSGCRDKFSEPMTLGGQVISAQVLNQGHGIYRSFCARCHGTLGDGRTTGMRGSRPPRDLSTGHYKFSSVAGSELPVDDDLKRTIRRGLRGNLMPGFATLPESDVHAVVQYLKTFSSRWQEEKTGTPITIPKDPWSARAADAVVHGKKVYDSVAKCATCHPGKVVDGQYGSVRSPDLSRDNLSGVFELRDVYRAVAVGLPGTGMPGYADVLTAEQIWAIAHYVVSLRPSSP